MSSSRLHCSGLLLGVLAGAVLLAFAEPATARSLELAQLLKEVRIDGAMAISPDGRHVYASSSDGLTLFERNPTTGELAPVGAHLGPRWARGAGTLTISPDGRNVYATQLRAVTVWTRNEDTGKLSLLESHFDGVAGVTGLEYPSSAEVSPDGRHVYVGVPGGVVVFQRQEYTGALSFVDVFRVEGLSSEPCVTISPEGKHLYVAHSRGLTAIVREETSGRLSFVESYFDGINGIDGLDYVYDIAVSPDGGHVYVAARNDFAVTVFSRHRATGRLSFVDVYFDGLGAVDGLGGANSLAISSDGRHLYATGENDHALAVFERNPTSGRLFYLEAHFDGVEGVDGLLDPKSATPSPDGRHVYAVDWVEGKIPVFARNEVSGRLTFSGAQIGTPGLHGANDVAMSWSGRNVYVSGRDGVAVFRRREDSGVLRFVEAHLEENLPSWATRVLAVSPDDQNVYALEDYYNRLTVFMRDAVSGTLRFLEFHESTYDSRSVAISPDGLYVYVASSRSLTVFARDALSGALRLVVTYSDDDPQWIDGLSEISSITISPEGRHVYVTADRHWEQGLVALFARDATSGALSFQEAHLDGVDGVDGLDGANCLAISPDGRYLYVASGWADNAIATFARDEGSGALRFQEALFHGRGGNAWSCGHSSITFSPDGDRVYLTCGSGLAVFARDTSVGSLAIMEVYRDGASDVDGLGGASSLAINADGDHLYVTGQSDNSIALFRVLQRTCDQSSSELCLNDNRFRAELEWRDFEGRVGSARVLPFGSDDSGMFWFFSPANWEILVKVLDGCSFNNRFWVFAAATTNVEYTLRITDTLTDATKVYTNQLGMSAPAVTDTDAFASCSTTNGGRSPTPINERLSTTYTEIHQNATSPDKLQAMGVLMPYSCDTECRCLTAEGLDVVDTTPVTLELCHSRYSTLPPSIKRRQWWTVEEDSGHHRLKGVGGKCLQPDHSEGSESSNLIIGPCGGHADLWNVGTGFPAPLVHSFTGLCLHPRTVRLTECTGDWEQLWGFEQVSCSPGEDNLCLNRSRFDVEVSWQDFEGNTGNGWVAPYGSDDSGLFWFFRPENWEMLVKIVDGCSFNDHYWVFAAATTNVEYTLRVTDTQSGLVEEYYNPLGRSAPALTDVQAFAACP